jgi:uncharacterized glyoxalase superfamily protein PhnB
MNCRATESRRKRRPCRAPQPTPLYIHGNAQMDVRHHGDPGLPTAGWPIVLPDAKETACPSGSSRISGSTPRPRKPPSSTFVAVNGGPEFRFDEAVSLAVSCETQDEIDYYWERLAEGGEEGPCGWLKDRYGLSWQVVPANIEELFSDADPVRAARAMQAMLGMRKLDIAALRDAADGPIDRPQAADHPLRKDHLMTSTSTSRRDKTTNDHVQARGTGWRAPDAIAIVRYRDPRGAIDWLGRAFGFEPHAVHEVDGAVQHAELRWGSGIVMLGGRDAGDTSADPRSSEGVYVVVEDADAHCERARAAGAKIVVEPTDQDYGSRDYQALDPEGHLWSFGTYRPS